MINKYAIVIELNGEMEKSARDSWVILEKEFSIKYISSRSPSPYITIDSGFTGRHDLVNDILKDLAKKITPFTICGNGLGIFVAGKPVIYIRWNLNKAFISLKNSITNALKIAFDNKIIKGKTNISEFNWLAKTSLAFNDTSYSILPEILNELKSVDYKKDMLVPGIKLYQYSIEEGENKIASFNFANSKK